MRVPALVHDGNAVCCGSMNEKEIHNLESNKVASEMGCPALMHVVRGMSCCTHWHMHNTKIMKILLLFIYALSYGRMHDHTHHLLPKYDGKGAGLLSSGTDTLPLAHRLPPSSTIYTFNYVQQTPQHLDLTTSRQSRV